MLGFAFIPIIIGVVILSFAIISGVTISTLQEYNEELEKDLEQVEAPNITENEEGGYDLKNPLIRVGEDAALNFPIDSFIDLIWGGVSGVVRWLVRFIILPAGNIVGSFAASFAAGHAVNLVLPAWIGYIVFFGILVVSVWRFWGIIWNFVLRNLVLVIIFLVAIFIIGVSMAFMGVV